MALQNNDSTQLAQQVTATLSHHINSPLMASLLDIEILRRRLAAHDTDVNDVLKRLEQTLLQIDNVLKVALQLNEAGLPNANEYEQLFAQQLAEFAEFRHTIDQPDESDSSWKDE